jgi:hypothetical protein
MGIPPASPRPLDFHFENLLTRKSFPFLRCDFITETHGRAARIDFRAGLLDNTTIPITSIRIFYVFSFGSDRDLLQVTK